jgi:putative two-component system response regulator
MATTTAYHHPHLVLLVDDDDAAREAMDCLLTIEGHRVESAASGRAALALLADGLRPCVMLLDVRMPEMDGWEVWDCMRAQQELRTTPVVLVSGETPDQARVHAVGIREFLQKPRPARDILGAVERHCRVASAGGMYA